MKRKRKALKLNSREWVLIFASLCVGLLLAEIGSRIYAWKNNFETGAHATSERRQLIGEETPRKHSPLQELGAFGNWLDLHPFFGFVFDKKQGENINNMGFATRHSIQLCGNAYCVDRDPDRRKYLVIGVFGGSFAHMMAQDSAYLEKKLATAFPGRIPVVLNFGVGGHAFPQALNIYAYFREVIDVAVFLDGLNELWNSVANNQVGYPPEFAKAIHFDYLLSADKLSPARFEATADIVEAKSRLRTITRLSLLPVVRSSTLAYVLWKRYANRQLSLIQDKMDVIVQSYEVSGTRFFTGDDAQILSFAARQWVEYHRLLDSMTKFQGVLSLHFLQPNPLVEGSKKLTPEENESVNTTFQIQDVVKGGYPNLRAGVRQLKRAGVLAEDLCDIYRDVSAPIWKDSAHPNEHGYRMVLDRIAGIIQSQKNFSFRAR